MSTPLTTETSFNILRRAALEGGFITKEDVSRLVTDHPKKQVLIRTGAGRFITSMDCCQHFVDIITDSTDYVRDVSLYIGHAVPTPKPAPKTAPKRRTWGTEFTPEYTTAPRFAVEGDEDFN